MKVESVSVEVKCGGQDLLFEDVRYATVTLCCSNTGLAAIVSLGKLGDRVLAPIDWSATEANGQIVLLCPDHKEKEKQ